MWAPASHSSDHSSDEERKPLLASSPRARQLNPPAPKEELEPELTSEAAAEKADGVATTNALVTADICDDIYSKYDVRAAEANPLFADDDVDTESPPPAADDSAGGGSSSADQLLFASALELCWPSVVAPLPITNDMTTIASTGGFTRGRPYPLQAALQRLAIAGLAHQRLSAYASVVASDVDVVRLICESTHGCYTIGSSLWVRPREGVSYRRGIVIGFQPIDAEDAGAPILVPAELLTPRTDDLVNRRVLPSVFTAAARSFDAGNTLHDPAVAGRWSKYAVGQTVWVSRCGGAEAVWQRGYVTGFGQGSVSLTDLRSNQDLWSWRRDPWQFDDKDVEDALGCPKVQITEGFWVSAHSQDGLVAVWHTERTFPRTFPRSFPFVTDQFPLFKSGWTMHPVMTTLGCWDMALEMNGWQLFSRLRLHKPFRIAVAAFDAITTACVLALFWGLLSTALLYWSSINPTLVHEIVDDFMHWSGTNSTLVSIMCMSYFLLTILLGRFTSGKQFKQAFKALAGSAALIIIIKWIIIDNWDGFCANMSKSYFFLLVLFLAAAAGACCWGLVLLVFGALAVLLYMFALLPPCAVMALVSGAAVLMGVDTMGRPGAFALALAQVSMRWLWHCAHPAALLAWSYDLFTRALGCDGQAQQSDPGMDLQWLAWLICTVRVVASALQTMKCLRTNPAFLLLDLGATARDTTHPTSGRQIYAMYVMAPDQITRLTATGESVPANSQCGWVLLDMCGMYAMVVLLFPSHRDSAIPVGQTIVCVQLALHAAFSLWLATQRRHPSNPLPRIVEIAKGATQALLVVVLFFVGFWFGTSFQLNGTLIILALPGWCVCALLAHYGLEIYKSEFGKRLCAVCAVVVGIAAIYSTCIYLLAHTAEGVCAAEYISVQDDRLFEARQSQGEEHWWKRDGWVEEQWYVFENGAALPLSPYPDDDRGWLANCRAMFMKRENRWHLQVGFIYISVGGVYDNRWSDWSGLDLFGVFGPSAEEIDQLAAECSSAGRYPTASEGIVDATVCFGLQCASSVAASVVNCGDHFRWRLPPTGKYGTYVRYQTHGNYYRAVDRRLGEIDFSSDPSIVDHSCTGSLLSNINDTESDALTAADCDKFICAPSYSHDSHGNCVPCPSFANEASVLTGSCTSCSSSVHVCEAATCAEGYDSFDVYHGRCMKTDMIDSGRIDQSSGYGSNLELMWLLTCSDPDLVPVITFPLFDVYIGDAVDVSNGSPCDRACDWECLQYDARGPNARVSEGVRGSPRVSEGLLASLRGNYDDLLGGAAFDIVGSESSLVLTFTTGSREQHAGGFVADFSCRPPVDITDEGESAARPAPSFNVASGSCTTSVSSSRWFIDGKATTQWGVCVRSPNFPERYEPNDQCIVDVLPGAINRTVSSRAFFTAPYDALTIDGQRYSGSSGPDHVQVTPGSTIEWSTEIYSSADGSYDLRSISGISGFELCIHR